MGRHGKRRDGTISAMAHAARQQQRNAKPPLRKAVFAKVDRLKRCASGHTLIANVLSSNAVFTKGMLVSIQNTCIPECVVGDETGTIVFTARNDRDKNFRLGCF